VLRVQLISLVLVLSGALVLGKSILQYFKTLQFMKEQTYDERTFNNWIYGAALAMMAFFFIGYIVVGVRLVTEFSPDYILVAVIFFFGAWFVFCMVLVQQTMAHTITSKTKETIQSMIDAMEAKDMYTKGHSEHVYHLVGLLYQNLPPEMRHRINPVKLQDAALLHDIGKIGIPDGILNKPATLTDGEYSIVKQHPKNGAAILEKTSYRDIGDWVKHHHERMDGAGYYNVPASAIPIEARIIAVADTFSALYTDRVYRKKFSFHKATEILRECAGTQLDAQLVDIFCTIDPVTIRKITQDGSWSTPAPKN
jgi:HD-GYP domain-containing protein (c-di-GMP phosphodiesterase class II)